MKRRRVPVGGVRGACAVLLACLPAWSCLAVEATWDFNRLMELLGRNSTFTAEFVELRSSFLLKRPLRLTGTIAFDARRAVEKVIESPFFEHFVIDRERVVIHRKNLHGKEQTVRTVRYSLQNYPFLSKAINGVGNVFAGDRELLDEVYHTTLSGGREAWELKLEPKHEKLAEFVDSIVVRGSGGVIEYVRTVEADGDESEMTLHHRGEG